MTRAFSGHSMRAGFVTSAVDKDKATVEIAPHTRHKSLSTLQGYVRNRDQWKCRRCSALGSDTEPGEG